MPAAANAADEAVSDKAEWLKQNLAALDKNKKPESRKISLSDADLQPVRKANRLRPFVPGRKLPTRRELDLQLAAQQARLDERKAQAFMVEQPPSLAGQVQAFASQPDTSAYAQIPASIATQYEKLTTKTKRPAAPAIAGQVPTLPGQVAYVPASGSAIPRMPLPEPPGCQANARMEAATTARSFEQPLKPGEHVVRQTGALLVQAPVLTPDQQEMMDELLQYNKGRGDQRFVDLPNGARQPAAVAAPVPAQMFQAPVMAAPPSDAGPPPFPLNMLPEGALKQLVGGRTSRPHIDAPPCYFGSWHKPVSFSNLPEAGFHSNIASRRITGKCYGHYAPTVGQGTPRLAQTRRRRFEYASSSQPEIAMYPPYGH
jgi:hypothetical protein